MVFWIIASTFNGRSYHASFAARATWKLVRKTFEHQFKMAVPVVGVYLPCYEGLVAHSFGYEPDVSEMWSNEVLLEIPLHIQLQARDETCQACGIHKYERSVQACARCRCVKYCSRFCQVQHWPLHKPVCGKI